MSRLQFNLCVSQEAETGNAHFSTALSTFPLLRLFTKTYAFRFSPIASFTSSTVSHRISGSAFTVFV